jgi:CRP-like cAMP-binding protein
MLETFRALPRLGAAILWAASRDEAVVVEHLVGLGRRDALTRTAHFLVELGLRLELVGLGGGAGFACPLNQYQLADVLGLTAAVVHGSSSRMQRPHPPSLTGVGIRCRTGWDVRGSLA